MLSGNLMKKTRAALVRIAGGCHPDGRDACTGMTKSQLVRCIRLHHRVAPEVLLAATDVDPCLPAGTQLANVYDSDNATVPMATAPAAVDTHLATVDDNDDNKTTPLSTAPAAVDTHSANVDDDDDVLLLSPPATTPVVDTHSAHANDDEVMDDVYEVVAEWSRRTLGFVPDVDARDARDAPNDVAHSTDTPVPTHDDNDNRGHDMDDDALQSMPLYFPTPSTTDDATQDLRAAISEVHIAPDGHIYIVNTDTGGHADTSSRCAVHGDPDIHIANDIVVTNDVTNHVTDDVITPGALGGDAHVRLCTVVAASLDTTTTIHRFPGGGFVLFPRMSE